jgi:hypothetical protein
MKKLSLILAGALLLGGISFASPVVKQDAKAPVAKQNAKPTVKTTEVSKAKILKKAPAKKGAPVKNVTK